MKSLRKQYKELDVKTLMDVNGGYSGSSGGGSISCSSSVTDNSSGFHGSSPAVGRNASSYSNSSCVYFRWYRD